MDKTSVVTAQIDADLRESAEEILARLGITPSAAIQMFYRQIVLTKGIPFDICLPSENRQPSAA